MEKYEKLARAMDTVRTASNDFNLELAAGVSQELRAQAERIKELEAEVERVDCLWSQTNLNLCRRAEKAEALAKTACNDALREALQGCNMVLATDQCGSGTEYDKGFKAAAQQCVDVVESHIEGDTND